MATKIRDNRTVTYNLAPQLVVPTQELLDRANQLRQDTLQYRRGAGRQRRVPIRHRAGAVPRSAGAAAFGAAISTACDAVCRDDRSAADVGHARQFSSSLATVRPPPQ